MGNVAYLIYSIVSLLLRIIEFLMLVRAIFSWIPVPPALSGIYRAVYSLTAVSYTHLRVFTSALEEAYRNLVMVERYPVCVLSLIHI